MARKTRGRLRIFFAGDTPKVQAAKARRPPITDRRALQEMSTKREAKDARARFEASEEVFQILRFLTGITKHGLQFDWDNTTLGEQSDQPWYSIKANPLLRTRQVRTLYKLACEKLYDHLDRKALALKGTHPCQTTPSEKKAARILRGLGHEVISKQLRHFSRKSQRPYPAKPIFGSFVPDFIIYGLKPSRPNGKGTKFQAVIIEIDGDAHDAKSEKDILYEKLANEHGIYVARFRNEQVHDLGRELTKMLERKGYKLAKKVSARDPTRIGVMLRSIACWLSPEEIAEHLKTTHGYGIDIFEHTAKLTKHSGGCSSIWRASRKQVKGVAKDQQRQRGQVRARSAKAKKTAAQKVVARRSAQM